MYYNSYNNPNGKGDVMARRSSLLRLPSARSVEYFLPAVPLAIAQIATTYKIVGKKLKVRVSVEVRQ